MRPVLFLIAAMLTLSACAEVQNETYSTIVLKGREYQLRTRTVVGANGPFESNAVFAHGRFNTCNPNSPGSCEAAVSSSRSRASR